MKKYIPIPILIHWRTLIVIVFRHEIKCLIPYQLSKIQHIQRHPYTGTTCKERMMKYRAENQNESNRQIFLDCGEWPLDFTSNIREGLAPWDRLHVTHPVDQQRVLQNVPFISTASSATYCCQLNSLSDLTRLMHSKLSGSLKHSSTIPRCSAHNDILYPCICIQSDNACYSLRNHMQWVQDTGSGKKKKKPKWLTDGRSVRDHLSFWVRIIFSIGMMRLIRTDCYFSVSTTFKGSLIDIGRTQYHILIIHYHPFRVHVNHESSVLFGKFLFSYIGHDESIK